MSTPARRPSHTPRHRREQRAYAATMVGGGAAVVCVVAAVLAIVGIIGWTLPVLAAIVTFLSALAFRRAVSR
jgi:hypothetical protein